MSAEDDNNLDPSGEQGTPEETEGREDIESDLNVGRPAHLPEESIPDINAVIQVETQVRRDVRPSDTQDAFRESLFAGFKQSRTTLYEVGEVARHLSVLPRGMHARGMPRHITLSFAIGLTFALLVTMAFAGGTWRLVLTIFAGTGVATLSVFGALRAVSYYAERHQSLRLPGSPLLWVGGVVFLAVGITIPFTWSVSEVTKPLAQARARRTRAVVTVPSAAPSASVAPERADRHLKRGQHVRAIKGGVLYVPPHFASTDGQFDLLIHYHGNVQMVEESVVEAGLNVLLLTVNLGDGSGRYEKPMRNPREFDRVLDRVEQRAGDLGLEKPRLGRLAISSWSAGYGAVYHILESRSRLDRVDAVFLLDSMHGSFSPGSKTQVHPLSLMPFQRFARRAMAGEKLMVITHSSIQTLGYPNTTQTADALLETLSLTREEVDPNEASPPPVSMPVVLHAFPDGRRWLRVINEAHQGSFHVYGCTGNGKGDHIAHLAQISVTILPQLAERWQTE